MTMPDPQHSQGSAAKTAVLLVNLGTPTAPTARAVRRFLAQFLHDRRVVQLTRWLWCPLLHFLILPLRSPKVAKKYAAIWLTDGSPLAVYTQRLAAAVQQRLPGLHVSQAMRYGAPALADRLTQLRDAGVQRVLVLPLYPQYSTTTTASVADVLAREADRAAHGMRVRMIPDYHLDPDWIAAVAGSIRAHWQARGRGDQLLFSFHGIPQRLVDAGDPYARQCQASAAAIVEALVLREDQYLLTFQSRFGRDPWLQPYTLPTLQALARQGIKRIDVVCPGFAVDCLETLEEIKLLNAEAFHAAGGESLRYIPCLNDTPAHADALTALVLRELETWQ